MWKGRTAAEVLVTPPDEESNPGSIFKTLAWCFEQCRGPVAFSMFGAQLPELYESLGSHLARSRRVYGVFDYRQYMGPGEQKVSLPFQKQYPDPWKTQDLAVGNSPYHSQILHDKKFCWNAPIFGYEPADEDYPDVETAFAAGACVSWFGSLNLSKEAVFQSNTIILMPGLSVGRMFTDDIRLNHDWITRNLQKDQPFPRQPWDSISG